VSVSLLGSRQVPVSTSRLRAVRARSASRRLAPIVSHFCLPST
jgi:hypothetical protein